jgi:hypothetical protein
LYFFTVAPTIIVREQVVGGWEGEKITLECMVEARVTHFQLFTERGQKEEKTGDCTGGRREGQKKVRM